MRYYIVNLAVHVIISIAMIVTTVIFSNRNRKRKTRHVLTFFLPTVMAVVTVFYVFTITWPRLLDLSDVSTQNYYSYTGEVESVSSFNNTMTIDGELYYINPMRELPEVGSKVRIRYTRYSKYVISVEPIDEVDVSGVINEELETAVGIPG